MSHPFSDKTKSKKKRYFRFGLLVTLLSLLLLGVGSLGGCGVVAPEAFETNAPEESGVLPEENSALSENYRSQPEDSTGPEETIREDGEYTSKEEVALYIHTYGHLPNNFITKQEAETLGWNSKEGNLWDVAYGKSIGGNKFGNYEKQLPTASGRKYYECDIDYDGGFRGAKRIIYSNDGLIFYTEDHYETFEQLY